MAIRSGNTCRGEFWSDARMYFPMLPRYYPVQRCPLCSHYYFFDDAKFGMADSVMLKGRQKKLIWKSVWGKKYDVIDKEEDLRSRKEEQKTKEMIALEELQDKIHKEVCENCFGELTYREMFEAEKDLLIDGVSDSHRELFLTTLIHAYNDAKVGRARSEKERIPEEYQRLFRPYAIRLIECLGESKTLTAELWREVGDFKKAVELCQKQIAGGKDTNYVRQVLERAEKNDSDVFQITV
ncbi:MAG: hypothetical protein K6G67_01455, partial [Lachnospiraceae bacterium]|nr:hypothetical protein [Lachnospiraceae bacterium]